jgi:hypothetical protein
MDPLAGLPFSLFLSEDMDPLAGSLRSLNPKPSLISLSLSEDVDPFACSL